MLRLLFVIALALFALPALAQAVVPDPGTDLAAFLQLAAQLWQGAQWAPLIALGAVALVAVLRRYGATWIPWLATRYGGLALAGGTALVGSIAQALLAGGPVAWPQVIANALVAAVLAVGGHSGVKNLAQGNKPQVPAAPGAPALLILLVALPLASGCATFRSNQHDLVCGVRDACVVCEGELVQDGVARQVAVTYCEAAEAGAPAAAVGP